MTTTIPAHCGRVGAHSPKLKPMAGASAEAGGASFVADPQLQRDIGAFNHWFTSLHPPVNKLRAEAIPGYRLGAVATFSIKDGEMYLSVPFRAIMHASKVFQIPVLNATIKKLNRMYNTEDKFHQLLFMLIHEKADPHSFWAPYTALLPKQFDNPVYWGDKDLEFLSGSAMKANCEREYSSLTNKYDAIKARVFDKFPEAFPPRVFTREQYLWAHSILDSRSIWMDGERNLVPMLDMVNCGEGPDPTRVHRSDHTQSSDTCDTSASWSFKPGDQVLENYGQPNNNYFKYHGFTLLGNSHDCVDIEMEGESFCIGGSKGLSSDFLQTIQMRHHLTSIQAQKQALDLVRGRLAGYKTSWREDAEILADLKNKGRQHAAIVFRAEEKRLLQRLLQQHRGKDDL